MSNIEKLYLRLRELFEVDNLSEIIEVILHMLDYFALYTKENGLDETTTVKILNQPKEKETMYKVIMR